MFSVKVITDDGHEFGKSEVVSYGFNPPILETGKEASVFVWYRNGEPPETFSGPATVYIMNENGKTIADYKMYSAPKIVMDTE